MTPMELGFLESQHQDALAMRRNAHLFDLVPQPTRAGDGPPRQYLLALNVTSMARLPHGEIVEHDQWLAMIHFPPGSLSRVDPRRVIQWIAGPLWHPNARPELGWFCVGRLSPGTPLRNLVFRIHEIVVYANWASNSPLNGDAAAWARQNQHRFPTDPRPLFWHPPTPSAAPAGHTDIKSLNTEGGSHDPR